MNSDNLLQRNRLSGPEGDAVSAIVNAILFAIGHNCRLLMVWFRRLLALLLHGAPGVVAEILRAFAGIIKPRNVPHRLAA